MVSLWNIIRDFFVQYIFGGHLSGNYQECYAFVGVNDSQSNPYQFTTKIMLDIGNSQTITLGDWLSTTGTLITMVIICVFLGFFVRWCFRLTAGLIRGN